MSALERRKQIISQMTVKHFCPNCKKEFLEERDLNTHLKPNKNGKSKCTESIVPRLVDKLQIFECVSDNCIYCTRYKSCLVSHLNTCKHIKEDKSNNNKNIITGDHNKINQNIDHSTKNIDHSTKNITINMSIGTKNNIIKYTPDMYYSIDTIIPALKSDNPVLELVILTNANKDTPELHNVIYGSKKCKVYRGNGVWDSCTADDLASMIGNDCFNCIKKVIDLCGSGERNFITKKERKKLVNYCAKFENNKNFFFAEIIELLKECAPMNKKTRIEAHGTTDSSENSLDGDTNKTTLTKSKNNSSPKTNKAKYDTNITSQDKPIKSPKAKNNSSEETKHKSAKSPKNVFC